MGHEELELSQFDYVQHLFHGLSHLTFTLDAAITGNSPMRIWVNNVDLPTSCFMWDRSHCYYFIGDAKNDDFNKEMIKLFEYTIIPFLISKKLDVYKLEYSSKEWEPFLDLLLEDKLPIKRARVFYTLNSFLTKEWRNSLPEHFEIRKIDEDLLNSRIGNIESIIDEINECWDSVNTFLKNGFGFCLVVHLLNGKKEIQGWCTGEYFSAKKCGIGIETFREYRKKGVATAMTSAFIEQCLTSNIQPHWDAFANNHASINVARKTGFVKIEDYDVYFGSFFNSELYQGYHFFSEKKYKIAAEWFEKAAELNQNSSDSYYYAACSSSLAGEINNAVVQLNKAIGSLKKPSLRFINNIRKNQDLEALHSNDVWKVILEDLRRLESRIELTNRSN
ncbi:MAG: GNAT family N-acetyltransferase [Candidatus Hodarchaeales archaeon]|jgi:GNAT superfamily N-acetyltransferase